MWIRTAGLKWKKEQEQTQQGNEIQEAVKVVYRSAIKIMIPLV
jgi:hypothetical protein